VVGLRLEGSLGWKCIIGVAPACFTGTLYIPVKMFSVVPGYTVCVNWMYPAAKSTGVSRTAKFCILRALSVEQSATSRHVVLLLNAFRRKIQKKTHLWTMSVNKTTVKKNINFVAFFLDSLASINA